MQIVLILIGFVSLLGGLVSLSNATAGVGGIGAACFFAILARMAQADKHQRDNAKAAIQSPTT